MRDELTPNSSQRVVKPFFCHSEERSTRKGYVTSVRQQSCQRLRSDVGIRNPRSLAPL